jgi:uncharacterized membrane protein YphA (DoxX/SURF4 family)
MFSTFPDGLPGFGLVILRFVLGSMLIVSVGSWLRNRPDWNLITAAVVLLTIASGLAIIAGYRTRLAAMAAAIAIIGGMIFLTTTHALDTWDMCTTQILGISMAISVACLGPGAFSLDSRMFGRREIVIPKTPKD